MDMSLANLEAALSEDYNSHLELSWDSEVGSSQVSDAEEEGVEDGWVDSSESDG